MRHETCEKGGSAPDGRDNEQPRKEDRANGEQDRPQHLRKFAVLLIDWNKAGNRLVQSETVLACCRADGLRDSCECVYRFGGRGGGRFAVRFDRLEKFREHVRIRKPHNVRRFPMECASKYCQRILSRAFNGLIPSTGKSRAVGPIVPEERH